MTWTLRRTVAVLAVAVLLGVASLVAYALGERQRGQIVGQGHRTAGVITDYERTSGWPDSAEVTYGFAGSERRASIYHPWHSPPKIGTDLDIYVDPADPQRIATADGYATGWSTGLPVPLAVLGGIAAFVGLSGYVTTARRRRWDAVDIAPEPAAATVGVRRRGVVRRVDVLSWFMFVLLAAGTSLGAWANWGSDDPLRYPAVAMFGGAAIGVYLTGCLGGRIVVTPRHLTIHQVFTVYAVPRGLVESVHLAEDGVLELCVRNAPLIRVATGAAALWGAQLNRRPAQLRAANRLRTLLVAVPPAGGGEEAVTRTHRWFTIGVAVLAGAGVVSPFVAMAG